MTDQPDAIETDADERCWYPATDCCRANAIRADERARMVALLFEIAKFSPPGKVANEYARAGYLLREALATERDENAGRASDG